MWLILLLTALPLTLPTTVTCDDLREWYTDDSGGGALSCCFEDGAQPTDLRQISLPSSESARLVFEDKVKASFPFVTDAEHSVHWDTKSANAILTLHDVTKLRPFLSKAATYLDNDGFPYLLIPRTPTIHVFVHSSRSNLTSLVPIGYPHATFSH